MIVKSDLNHGGYPEYRTDLTGVRRLRPVRAVARRLGATPTWHDYRVFERRADVPASLAERSDLVVERFLPEIEDGLYHLRMYQFLGDHERTARLSSPEPIFKADTSSSAQIIEPHAEVLAWREELGLDFGKIDYTVHEGEVILLDTNKTTGASRPYLESGTLRDERRRQAEGIHAYFTGLKPL